MELFASFDFFLDALLASLALSVLGPLAMRARISLRYVLAFFSILTSALVFWDRPLQAVIVLVVQSAALWLCRRGYIATRVAVVLTMLPLLLVKTHALTFLGMIGLSFVTFRAVDVLLFAHKNETIHPLDYVTYLFFPLTLLAGPMYRWRNFQADLQKGFGQINMGHWRAGFETTLLGIVQKFAIAHLIWLYGLNVVSPHDYSLRGVVLNAVLYSAYLYFDFAGYSNMAAGIGKMFGVNLPSNFNNPILSKNPQDFWRRWHISLSEWLRDVVFMPIYKALSKDSFFSQHRFAAQNIGIFATLFCMGIWNGLQLHYIVSGMMFGTYSVVHNRLVFAAKQRPALQQWLSSRPAQWGGRVLTLAFAMLALYVFSGRSPI
ncbi:membrane-bound O-acyltransferase [Paralcaligenes sp. KSB-10]|uniref:MBOAT family O-acyltransferase n=1 Tax=Paralcaligenes sp. KSB-10 TaxID=2901142 RepID=UPI001E5ED4CA|nr:MBOAT family O-acyltransferase [Paralcaligenes sp. KSB-10]UHL65076.1 membrane-bound O-acyltransferase [Paralcaligenes sp. KSB-10]